MSQPRIAIIGGSGLYEMEGLEKLEEKAVPTPFGAPSDHFLTGQLNDVPVAFLPRHARGHKILPSELNFRANIYAIKSLGCEFILSVSAVGSLREDIEPGQFVMVDQFIDRTYQRISTFFGEGVVGHVAFAEPVCGILRKILYQGAADVGVSAHLEGTYVCIEGPMFSSRAESQLYRKWGADVIGMTNLQEARLAREAGLCYATMALSTDYDCWHEDHESVTADMVIKTLKKNVANAQKVLKQVIPLIPKERSCKCAAAVKNAIITDKKLIPEKTKEKLQVILGDLL